jgi:hypothetical protein
MFLHSFTSFFDDLFKTVIQDGDNDPIVNSICNGLFERNRELYIEDEFDADDNLIYSPPPLHNVWLNETGHRQGKKDLIWQRCRNEDLMHAQRQNVSKMIGRTPTPPSVVDNVPDRAAVLDDESVASSVAVKIQNQRETMWMTMMMMKALFISQIHLLHQI